MKNLTLSEMPLVNPVRFREAAQYGNDCLVAHHVGRDAFRESVTPFLSPVRFDVLIVVLCIKGDLWLQCDMQTCRLQSGCLLLVKPGSVIQVVKGDMECMSVIAAEQRFSERLDVSISRLVPHFSNLEKLTVLPLDAEDCMRIDGMISHLMDSLKSDSGHLFYHELVMSKFTALSYELIHAFTLGLEGFDWPQAMTAAPESVFRRFMELLGEHYRKERKVSFYAREMGITPKHLSHQVRIYSSHSPLYWIDEYVMSEARSMLQNADMTIQMVSDYLNFADQSFFGKYFKKHMGVSPKVFRQGKVK